MTKIVALDGQRLDTIVYKHYGTLEVFSEVLKLNSHLDPILKLGDIVLLPDIEIKKEVEEEKALW